jgi:hypothetical protein
MPRLARLQVRIKGRSDNAGKRTPFIRHGNPTPVNPDKSCRDKWTEPRKLGLKIFFELNLGRNLVEIDFEVAHQVFNDARAQAIALRQRKAFCRGDAAALDGLRVASNIYRILQESLGQATYRRGAQADQRVGVISRVSLKVAPESF